VAEDHTILREGLRALLSSKSQYLIAGEARDGLEAIRLAARIRPDLVLMDLSLPKISGMDAIIEIKRVSPATKILVLTVHKTEEYVAATFRAGADGYILKDATSEELEMAINKVLEGYRYLSPSIADWVIEGFLEGKRTQDPSSPWESLTQREREVLKLVAEGYKNKEIADYLCISPKTVERHRANLMRKLNLHSASALTAYAMEKGLVTK